MSFKVANVICLFNSNSGGPPGTVSLIARAGLNHWNSELFTTDHTDSQTDTLLTSEFPGQVHWIDKSAKTFAGAIVQTLGFPNVTRTQLTQLSRPDIVHLHGLWSLVFAAYAREATRAGIPYIVAPHGMLEPWSLTIHRTRKRLALRTYQGTVLSRAAAIHTTSEAEAEHVRALGYRDTPIFVVPNPVEEPHAAPAQSAATTGLGRHVLLFLSRLHEKKGLDNLLSAWNALRPEAWELKIVGHGESSYVEHLQALCRNLQMPNISFHPHVDGGQREAMFESATAFVLPTFSENFGNAIAEAMLRGLPVVTTTGTPWSVIALNKFGWYIAPDLDNLTRALKELFATDVKTLREMGNRAKLYARENLLIDSVRARLLTMYQATLGRPR